MSLALDPEPSEGALVVKATVAETRDATRREVFLDDVPIGWTSLDTVVQVGDYELRVGTERRPIAIDPHVRRVERFEVSADPEPSGLYPTVLVPVGTFMMGSPEGVGDSDEHPAHEATVSAYALGVTEVGQCLADALLDGADPTGCGKDVAATGISWCDAVVIAARCAGSLGRAGACRPRRSGSAPPGSPGRGPKTSTSTPGTTRTPAGRSTRSGRGTRAPASTTSRATPGSGCSTPSAPTVPIQSSIQSQTVRLRPG